MTSYSHATELRKIHFELDSLAYILEDDWRSLFYLIPRRMSDIDKPPGGYPTKYNGSQERELDEVGQREHISRARLLLEEWSTSGRLEERPTLGHLLQLLAKGSMFRAADYVAKLLKVDPPERPQRGPAAPIDVNLALDLELEKDLDDGSYPDSSALLNGLQSLTLENNLDRQLPEKRDDVVGFPPVIPDSIMEGSLPQLSNTDNNEQSAGEDVPVPMISALLGSEQNSMQAGPSGLNAVPMLSILGNTLSSTSDSYTGSSSSSLRSDVESRHEPSSMLQTIEEDNELPDLSIFGRSGETNAAASTSNVPRFSALFGNASGLQEQVENSTSGLPRLSAIGLSNHYSSNTIQHNSNLIQFSSASVSGPALASFPYSLLQSCTANFDERPFTNGNENIPNGRKLGNGGFGEVFLGKHLAADVPLAAVKRLFPSNYKYREKFDRERDILSKHHHPNIVRLLGYSDDSDRLCLVYEYVSDGTLEAMLNKSRSGQVLFAAAKRLHFLLGVALAIEYLHSPQVLVIHRDVTLGNILLQGDVAKLCDFGLVKRVDSMTATGVLGTGPYLAPEALRGTVTPALDIYSFGVVLAEVVTGEGVLMMQTEPTGGEDLLERVNAKGANLRAMVDDKVQPEERDRWIYGGEKLLELVNWCLRERMQRPNAQTMRERVQAIERELQ